eukprot:gene7557-8357_t
MMDPSHQPALAAAHSHDSEGHDDSWVHYSSMDKSYFTALLTAFSLSTTFISHPLTVLTIRQQASSSLISEAQQIQHQSVTKAMRQSMATVGLKGLFRGWIPIAMMGIPSDVEYYSAMEHSRELTQRNLKTFFPNTSIVVIDMIQTLSSSIIASFLSRIPYVPAEVISTRMIVQGRDGLNSWAMSRHIYEEQGIKGFFRGFSSSYLVAVVSSTIWWWTYSSCRRVATKAKIGNDYPVATDALAGFLSGFTAILFSHPFDTIKTRVMTAAKSQTSPLPSFSKEFVSVIRKNGFRALYRGLPASLYQTALGSTFFATSYELIKVTSSTSTA